MGLAEVEYVGHLVTATGTSFTSEKRMKVLDFPHPTTRELFPRSCAEHERDGETLTRHDPSWRIGKLIWTAEGIAAFKLCQQAISNCQELYFLEDTATPILQTDTSDYGIGGYLYMLTNGKVRVVRFFSKALVNWSTSEKECYGIYFGVKTFEDLLDNRHFILKTDHTNLIYLNVTLTGKVQRWRLQLERGEWSRRAC